MSLEIRNKLEQLKGHQRTLLEEKNSASSKLNELYLLKEDIEEARKIIQVVAQQTQQEVELYINEIVTTALSVVYDEPYEFKIKFVLRRNKTEADLFFVRDGFEINPMDESGGGPLDISSLALRVALRSLNGENNRNVLVLDEPFKNLDKEVAPRAVALLKMIAENRNLQIIMVSHSPFLIEGADTIYMVKKKKGKSYMEKVK